MNQVHSALTFGGGKAALIFAIIVLLLGAVLCFMAWRRSGYGLGHGFLELLRFLILGMVAITLLQPEWRELFEPKEKPTLAVLWDQSASMTTTDVVNRDNPEEPMISRAEAIRSFLDESRWAGADPNLDIVMGPFSSKRDPSESGTDLNGALLDLLEQHSRLRAVVLVSDGDWNVGASPAGAATQLKMAGAPVFAVPVGSETRLPDLEIAAFDPPTFAIAGKPLRVPFAIESSLPREHPVEVVLTTSTGERISKQVTLPAMGRLEDAIAWLPKDVGDVDLTVEASPAPKESNLENNKRVTPIQIRKEELRVLVIECFPRWEYRYLRNALERDPGVEVSCLLFHPDLAKKGGGRGYLSEFPTKDELAKFDVVFLGDVGTAPGQLSEEQCSLLAGLVRNQASGLVFLPGFRGHHASLLDTELGELYPVQLDSYQPRGWGSPSPGTFQLTELGRRSLLTKLEDGDDSNAAVWASLPGFQWFAAVERAKAGAEVLAVHSSDASRFGRVPLIVTRTAGAGKILFMGTDGAWRWREGVEDKYHYRFWGQVARWMAYQRGMAQGERMRLFYSPDRPQAQDLVTLNANVMSLGGEPLAEATVIVSIAAPSGKTETVRLSAADEEAWGLFTGRFTPTEDGIYRIEATCRENGAVLETEIAVQGDVIERLGRPARPEVLEEVARLSRGELIADGSLEKALAAVAALPEPEPTERRLLIWAHWAWATLLIVLMTIFWIGRKAIGTV